MLVIGRSGQLARALGEEMPDAMRLGREDVDLADPVAAERAVGDHSPDVLINAAAYTDVERAERDVEVAYAVNRDGVAALARGAASVGAALLHVSTDYVFDGRKRGEWRETDPTWPLNVYGASKLAGEREALAANARTLILRTSWVYSPWGRNFVTTMLRLADREKVTVVDDQHGKPTSALSLARAIHAIVPRLAKAPAQTPLWGIRHYAGRGTTTWAGFARETFARARGKLVSRIPQVQPINSADFFTCAGRPRNSALDCRAFEHDFGVATVDWCMALDEVLDRIANERGSR